MILSPDRDLVEEAAPASIELIGYQRGPGGFVRYGTPEGTTKEWEDYLYLLVHGGVGSGKTRGGAYRLLHYLLSWPDAFGIILTPTHEVFRTSTLLAIKQVFAQAGLREGYHWSENKSEHLIKMEETGASAWYHSTEEPDTILGQSAAIAWLDEAARMPFVAFQNIQKRLRQTGFPHQCLLSTTPTGRLHWLHALFYPDHSEPDLFNELGISSQWDGPGEGDVTRSTAFDDGSRVSSHYKSWQAATRDNPYGGKELYAQIVAVHGADSPMARQELFGGFELVAGLTYSSWDARHHVVNEEKWPSRPEKVLAGVDFGFAAPAAIVVEGIDSAGRRYLLDEFYRAGCSERELIGHARRLAEQYGIRYFFGDPADPRWMSAMRHAGIRILNANKKRGTGADPSYGIGLCSWALTHRVNGEQGFFVSPKLRRYRMEIENYVREEARLNRNPKELPRQKGDHAMDAWRYAEMAIARLWDRPERRNGHVPVTNIPLEMSA